MGETVGDYEIVSRIRSGGMATLYLARRRGPAGFEREVALKIVHPHLAGETRYIEMFLDEARLAARIDHPNVVHIHEVGEGHGTWFLVMEYVHGVSLWQVERALDRLGRGVSVEMAVSLAISVADGLHAAHDTTDPNGNLLDVVHRDVSPQNILIASRGHIKLIDFGIAKARGRLQETVGGNLKGKIRYMAPEQALGRPVDRRTDVYALGIVLWEMLARKRFWASADAQTLLEQVRAPRNVPPSRFAMGIPPALDAVVMDALSVDPEQRIPTAYEFRRRLAEAVPLALAIDSSQVAAFISDVIRADQATSDAQGRPSEAPADNSPNAPPIIDLPDAPPDPFDLLPTKPDPEHDSSPSPLLLPPVEISVPSYSALKTVVLPPAARRSYSVQYALMAGLAVFALGIGVTLATRGSYSSAPVSAAAPIAPVAPVAPVAPLLPPVPSQQVLAPSPDASQPDPSSVVEPEPEAPVAIAHPVPARPPVVTPAPRPLPVTVRRPDAPLVAAPLARPNTPVLDPPAPQTVVRPQQSVSNTHGSSNVPIVEQDPF